MKNFRTILRKHRSMGDKTIDQRFDQLILNLATDGYHSRKKRPVEMVVENGKHKMVYQT